MKYKFNYYFYFKNQYYHLVYRKTKKDITFVSFYSAYCYIKEHKISFSNIKMNLTMDDLFRYYCSFDREKERI